MRTAITEYGYGGRTTATLRRIGLTERQVTHLSDIGLLPSVGSGNRLVLPEETCRCAVVAIELARAVFGFRRPDRRTPGKPSVSIFPLAMDAAMRAGNPPDRDWAHLHADGEMRYAERPGLLPAEVGVRAWFDCDVLDQPHRSVS